MASRAPARRRASSKGAGPACSRASRSALRERLDAGQSRRAAAAASRGTASASSTSGAGGAGTRANSKRSSTTPRRTSPSSAASMGPSSRRAASRSASMGPRAHTSARSAAWRSLRASSPESASEGGAPALRMRSGGDVMRRGRNSDTQLHSEASHVSAIQRARAAWAGVSSGVGSAGSMRAWMGRGEAMSVSLRRASTTPCTTLRPKGTKTPWPTRRGPLRARKPGGTA